MNNSFSAAVTELESFKTGEPLIITRSGFDEEGYVYSIIAYIHTIDDWTPQYTDSVHMRMFLPFTYPINSPNVKVLSKGFFYPNFTADGVWADGEINENESIFDYLSRLILALQYKDISTTAIGNRNVMGWYNREKGKNIFPTDKINYNHTMRIQILNRND